MLKSRFMIVCMLLFVGATTQAAPPMNAAALATIDRATLDATQNGDILGLEPYLAANFQAAIKVPDEQGRMQTLLFSREEFLLYAWNALNVAENYQVTAHAANYNIDSHKRSAIGTRLFNESVLWNGQQLRYTTLRTTHYRPATNSIQITLLEINVVK